LWFGRPVHVELRYGFWWNDDFLEFVVRCRNYRRRNLAQSKALRAENEKKEEKSSLGEGRFEFTVAEETVDIDK
jgi:hypothetical protein